MHNIVVDNAGDALLEATSLLISSHYAVNGIPGIKSEMLNVKIQINGGLSLPCSEIRKFNYRSMIAESLWNLQNTRDITFLKRYVPAMGKFCDNTDTAQWAYGPYLNSTILPTLDLLKFDPHSRQAIVYTGRPLESTPGNSPPCLSTVQWFIRGGRLHQIVSMRSNDVYLGLPLDIAQFSLWHIMAAAYLDCAVGNYIHNAASLHLYTRDTQKARKFLEGEVFSCYLPAVQKSALVTAVSNNMPNIVTHHEFKDDHILAPYLELLSGNYSHKTWAYLKNNGYGCGW